MATLFFLCFIWGCICAFLMAYSGHTVTFVMAAVAGSSWLTWEFFKDLADMAEEEEQEYLRWERDDYDNS